MPAPDLLAQNPQVSPKQYLQLLELLAGQKALACCLEEDDARRHQLLPLPLQPGDHPCLEEYLVRGKAIGDSSAPSDCLQWGGLAIHTLAPSPQPAMLVGGCHLMRVYRTKV